MLSDRLISERKRKKYTQEKVADFLGITRPAYTAYERGNRQPDYETLKKLAELFEVTTDYLLGFSNTPDLSEKDEKDVAKRMEELRKDIASGHEGLSFNGEPMSEEAIDSFLESMEHIMKQTQRINKKYIPKKYREDNKE
ncbi:helix-turn-helix domain-containing protein [Metabacillus bambusae]|uniref:Helix-turn-helix domain-containing protein n=1 Tax=Metabacillus bambusae TaxID=2795218 RepID=A0ABS3NCH3_9BACI|nr:helix-turn-helix domain-containing protein [Metabacillus bambusae]MBO1515679.1 helix-turn-helix domain-containing protein [Metabacillus bambusae]